MDDFEIEIYSNESEQKQSVQLPMNFLTIGEVDHDDVKVYIRQSVFRDLEKYASSDTDHELGTIILGHYSEESGKTSVIISEYIIAKYTDASASTLTFTHETWNDVYREHDEKYPELKIIGWQHTHPGYGIFLSNYDMFIQENFFNLPFQVAYVIDPIQHLRGFFQWKNGKVEKLKGFYIYDDVGVKIAVDASNRTAKSVVSTSTLSKSAEKKSVTVYTLLYVMVTLLLLSFIQMRRYSAQLSKTIDDQLFMQATISAQQQDIQYLNAEIDQLRSDLDDAKSMAPADDTNRQAFLTEPEQTLDQDNMITDAECPAESNGVSFTQYIVQAGDSLYSICKQTGLDFTAYHNLLLGINGIPENGMIHPGQVLILPS